MKNYELIIIRFHGQVCVSAVAEKVKALRIDALLKLRAYLTHYDKLGYREDLLTAIATKKGDMIMSAATKTELEKILVPRCPHYNGNKFIPDQYSVLEEELICWGETSLKAPLNEAGFKRYMEVCSLVYPEEFADAIGLKGA